MKCKKLSLPRNWREYLIVVKTKYPAHETEYVLRFKDELNLKNPEIGYLNVVKKGKYNFVKVVSVIPSMQGKGCGSMLYEYAINDLSSLSTNYHDASSLAQRVWKRLIKKYRHTDEFFTGVLTVFKKGIDKPNSK